MELRHLRYVLAVVDEGTVSAASAAVHVSQPSLSRQVRQLERELGVDVFNRSTGRLSLSRTGEELVPLIREVVDRASVLSVSAARHAAGRLDRVIVAAPPVTLAEVVAPFVATLGPDDPTMDVLATQNPMPSLTVGGADLVVTTGKPPASTITALAALPVYAQVPQEHPLLGRTHVGIDDLARLALIVPGPSTTAREAFEMAMTRADAFPEHMVEVDTGVLAQALAASGRGVAVVSDEPRFGLAPLRIMTHEQEELAIRLRAAWDPRHPASTQLADLAERLGSFVRELYRAPAQ